MNVSIEFNSELPGEDITLNNFWAPLPINTDEGINDDSRWEAYGDENNLSIITMKRTNQRLTRITFCKDAIVATSRIRIRYNISDVIKREV